MKKLLGIVVLGLFKNVVFLKKKFILWLKKTNLKILDIGGIFQLNKDNVIFKCIALCIARVFKKWRKMK